MPLGYEWTLRVFKTEAAWRNNEFFRVSSNILSDSHAAADFVGEFGDGLEQNGHVYIYKELVSCHFFSKSIRAYNLMLPV